MVTFRAIVMSASKMAKVCISDRVWEAWREEVARAEEEWGRGLLLSVTGDQAAAARATVEVLTEAQDANAVASEAAARVGADPPPFIGEWCWIRVARGVASYVTECDEFGSVLPMLASALGARGVDVRLKGARERRAARDYRWRPDSDASRCLLAAADRGCRRGLAHPACSLSAGLLIAVGESEELLDLDRGTSATVTAITDEAFAALRLMRGQGG